MTSQVSFTVRTGVMDIHALVDATRNQAATKPTSQQRYDDTRDISDHAGLGFRRRVYFSVAMRTNCVSRLRPKWDDSGDYGRPVCVSLRRCERTGWRYASDVLRVSGRRVRRRFVGRRWSILVRGLHRGVPFLTCLMSELSEVVAARV